MCTYKSPCLWYGSVRAREEGNFPTVDWVYYSHSEPGFSADKLTDCTFRLFPLDWECFFFCCCCFIFFAAFTGPFRIPGRITASSLMVTYSFFFLIISPLHPCRGNNYVQLDSRPIIVNTARGKKKCIYSRKKAFSKVPFLWIVSVSINFNDGGYRLQRPCYQKLLSR